MIRREVLGLGVPMVELREPAVGEGERVTARAFQLIGKLCSGDGEVFHASTLRPGTAASLRTGANSV